MSSKYEIAAIGSIDDLVVAVKTEIIQPIIYLLFALALIYFFYGVYKFIRNGDNEKERAIGQQHMIWGLVGLFIMISVFGIMNLICTTIGCQ